MAQKESDRILSLEINFENFMKNVEDKFCTILKKLDEFPNIYATKNEVSNLKDDIRTIKSNTNSKKLEWIKVWGGWIVALI